MKAEWHDITEPPKPKSKEGENHIRVLLWTNADIIYSGACWFSSRFGAPFDFAPDVDVYCGKIEKWAYMPDTPKDE